MDPAILALDFKSPAGLAVSWIESSLSPWLQ